MISQSDYMCRDENFQASYHGRRGIDLIVIIFVIYYWLLQFIHGDGITPIFSEFSSFLYIVPAAGFAVLSSIYIVFTATKIDRSAFVLLAFCGVVVVISLSRGDYRSIASLGLLSVSVAALFQMRPKISINIINLLFLGAAGITTVLYFFDLSIYTFLPAVWSSYGLWWRVSPLPSVAAGALLAMFVFLINIMIKEQPFRRAMLFISIYFVMLSGSRTAISGIFITSLYILLRKYRVLDHRGVRIAFIVASLTAFVAMIYASQILFMLPFSGNALLRTLILRDEAVSGFDFGGQVGTAAIRQWVFDQHIAAFWESPFTGIGTFDLRMLNSGYGALDDSVTGSEAFVTGLLARIGLVSILFFAAVFLVRQPLRGAEKETSTVIRIALMVAMVTYGSFVNVYDVIFFLMIVAVAGGVESLPRRVGDISPSAAPI